MEEEGEGEEDEGGVVIVVMVVGIVVIEGEDELKMGRGEEGGEGNNVHCSGGQSGASVTEVSTAESTTADVTASALEREGNTGCYWCGMLKTKSSEHKTTILVMVWSREEVWGV